MVVVMDNYKALPRYSKKGYPSPGERYEPAGGATIVMCFYAT